MNQQNKTVADVGEFGLIDRIQQLLPLTDHPDVVIGIGDDTAVIRNGENLCLLITCDIQVEDQHFNFTTIAPYQLGRRAMAVNLSDIAAMGGRPSYALVSLGFPRSFPLPDFESLIEGMRDQLSEFSAAIIGGNLSRTGEKLIIDITLMGDVQPDQYLTRAGARAGDRLFVTGSPGAAAAGLAILQKYGTDYPAEFERLVQKHLQPIPRIAAGQRIAQSGFATAMIDVSDGIASDLNHICTSSNVGAEIYTSQLPVTDEIKRVASLSGASPLELMLQGGEDYELLFTLKPDTPDSVANSIIQEHGVNIVEIGTILPEKSGYYRINEKRQKIPVLARGWDHFYDKK